jgi:hypothetical protein
MICNVHEIFRLIKSWGMRGRSVWKLWKRGETVQGLVLRPEVIDHWEDIGIDGRVNFKYIFNLWYWHPWTGIIWLFCWNLATSPVHFNDFFVYEMWGLFWLDVEKIAFQEGCSTSKYITHKRKFYTRYYIPWWFIHNFSIILMFGLKFESLSFQETLYI